MRCLPLATIACVLGFLLAPASKAEISYAISFPPSTEIQFLGRAIFHDANLSRPRGQSCVSCHSPRAAFSDPRPGPVSRGASGSLFGNRNAPSILYALFVPPLHLEQGDDGPDYIGGLFWDGRAENLSLQAAGPFLNPLEMGTTKLDLVNDVCNSRSYGILFRKLAGASACPDDPSQPFSPDQVTNAFAFITNAVADFERAKTFAPFSAKFDAVQSKQAQFSDTEARGFEVFKDPKRGNCAACHTLDAHHGAPNALFTDFSYDNLGLPLNPVLAAFGHNSPDHGLFLTTGREKDHGRFRTPTLRNIELTPPYGHNGYFRTLEQVVDFYSTRDLKPRCADNFSADQAQERGCWPAPEVAEGVNREELGKIDLSSEEKEALLAFLHTLNDGFIR